MNIYCTFFPFFAHYELNNTYYVQKLLKFSYFLAVLKTTKTCATDKKKITSVKFAQMTA